MTKRTTQLLAQEAVTDQELARKAGRGDRVAFAQLIGRHQRTVYYLALSVLGDPDAAWDSAQDTFIRLWDRLSGFRGEAPLKTWISRVAVHVAVDHRRRQKRCPERGLEPPALARMPDRGSLPDDDAHRSEIRDRLARCFERLGAMQRTVLSLREMEGMSYAQIARVLRIPVGTVMSRLFYARRALRALLEAEEPALLAAA